MTRSCFDKTGTLTRGEPEVVEIATADGVSEQELLRLVAARRGRQRAPARAGDRQRRAQARPAARVRRGLPGGPRRGREATVEGHRLAVGNARLLEREHVSLDGLAERAESSPARAGRPSQVALDGKAAGVIAIADSPRDTAKAAVAALRELGVRAVMLTGDSEATAERVAAEVGIDDVIAEVLPQDKAAR